MHHFHRTKPRISRIEPLEARIAPATFFVLNTNDTGAGSLRQAIVDANAAPNGGAPDLISFASIPTSGPFVIQPLSPLPAIIEAVIIDGYTAPNTSVNTLAIGTDAVLRVEINAALQGNGHGLVLSGTGGSTVTGLVIRGTPSAINDNGDGVSVRSDNNVVAGNFIGTDVTGTLDFGNRSSQVSVGLFLGTDVFTGNVIGGTAPAARNILSGGALGISLTDDSFGTIIQGNLIGTDRTGNVAIPNNNTGIGGSAVDTLIGGSVAGAGNVISGNDGWGINFSGSNTTIQGNIIGLNAAGNAPLPNTRSGINFSNGATTALVGGAGAGQANVISGNDGEGIEIGSSFGDGPGNGITVLGNFIGTNASGVMGLGNGGPGIGVYGTNGAIIGGVNPGQRNVIAFNGGDGVFMQEVATEIYGVTVSGNSIHSNVGLGINIADLGDNFFGVTGNDSIDSKDKDTGPNGLQNFPIGTGFTNNGSNITLDGFLASKANASYRLEFFAMAPGQVDLSGHGEGFLFLGSQVVTTTIDGDAGFSFGAAFNLPPDTKFAATATDLTTGETSEFGPAFGPATTFTWTGAVDADWFNSGNWSPGGVPGPLDTAVLGSGTIMLDELATVAGFQQTGGTLDGLGELNVLGTWTWMGGAHAGGTLRTIEGSTAILNGGTALQWMDGDLENRGTLTVQGLGVQFERGTLSNGGDVTLLAGFTDSDAMLSPVTVFNYGSIIKSGATDFGFEGITVENQGGLIRSESTSFFPNFLIGTLNQFDGVTAVAQGGYIVPGGIQLFGGFFDGSNTGEFVTANVTNSGGVVRPGGPDAVGFIFLTGDYIQTSGGTLEIEIGTGLGFPSDEFYVSGGSIDGALLHKTIDGRIIRAGDSFAVVNGGLSGSFSTVNGQPPLNVAYNANDITLFATGFTVTNVNDSGAGSLRQAILDANAQPGFDFISFNIPAGGVQTIRPLTELPVITEAVNIDGYSQPGANANTLAVGSDAVLRIELDGSLVPNGPGSESGITFGGTGALTVSGLIINRFDGYGVELLSGTGSRIAGNWIGPANDGGAMGNSQFGIWLDDTDGVIIGGTSPADRNVISNNDGNGIEISNAASGAIIQGNYIGTDASGTAALPNGFDGIYTQGANTQIGGIAPGAGNVISASLNSVGILINTATAAGSRVEGNFIGTDATGMVDLGNFSFGVEVVSTPNVTIGGTAAGAGNLISGNGDAGIAISGAASTGAIVHGNRVGTDVGGAMPLGNDGGGVAVFAASGASIGGISVGEGNVIAFNTGDGVKVDLSGGTAAGNAIRGNSIHSNTKLGINLVAAGDPDNGITANDADDLDAGANALLNFPVLTSFTAGVLSGNYHGLANTTFTLDIYGSAVADPSGNGEGEMLIATTSITTDGSGNATFSLPGLGIASGFITATATRNSTGDTSEFSNAIGAAAAGSTFVWDNGAGNGDWFDPINWDLDSGVPGLADTAILNIASTINLTAPVAVATFTQTTGTVTGGGNMTVGASFAWNGGTQSGAATLIIGASATATLSGGGTKTLDRRFIQNDGTLTITGSGALSLLNGPTITNNGIWEYQSDADLRQDDTTGALFENTGSATLRKSTGNGGAATVIGLGNPNLAFENDGTVDISAGNLTVFSSGGAWNGSPSVAISAGATFGFTGGSFSWNAAPALSGGGTLDVGGAANVTLAGGTTLTVPAGFTLSKNGVGSLEGGGSVVVNGALTLAGGAHSGAGTTTIAAGGTLVLSDGSTTTLDTRQLVNNGTVTQFGSNLLTLTNNATITSNTVWQLDGDGDVSSSGGATAFTIGSGGVLRKISGTGNSEISVPLNHTDGTGIVADVVVQSGALRLLGGGTWDGTDPDVSAGASLEIAGGTLSISNRQVYVNGAGTVRINGGTLNLVDRQFATDAATTFEFTSGTLTNQNDHDLVVFGPATWSGGDVVGASTSGGIQFYGDLAITGAANRSVLGQVFDFAGGITTFSMTGNINLVDDSGWNARGIMNITGNGGFTHSGAAGAFFANVGNGTTGGILRKNDAGTTNFGAGVEFSATGLLELNAGTLNFVAPSYLLGTTVLQGGALSATGTIDLSSGAQPGQEGILTGAGTITANVVNTSGVVAPGGTGAAGTLTIMGTYTQGAGGTLAVELGGTTAGSQYDVLNVTGTATLAGTLNIANISAFTPTAGNNFRVVQSAGNPGTFTTLSGATAGISQSADATGLVLMSSGLTYVWDNTAGDGDWFNPLNWDLDSGVPGAADTAILNIASTINLTTGVSVSTFTQTAGTVTGVGNMTIGTSFTWSGGTQSGAATLIIGSGGTLTLSGPSVKTLDTRTLRVDGSGIIAGTGDLAFANGGTLENAGTFEIQTDADFTGSGGLIHNFLGATFRKTTATGLSTITGANFQSEGAVVVQSGSVNFAVGGTSVTATGATWNVSSGAQIEFQGGVATFNGAHSFSGGGIVEVSGAGVTAASGAVLTFGSTVTLRQSAGTINGSGAVDVNGTFDWSGGTQTGLGITTIINTGSAEFSGAVPKTLDRRITVSSGATLVISGDGVVNFSPVGRIDVSGTLEITSTGSFDDGGVPGSIVAILPEAIVRVNSSGTFSLGIEFENEGSLLAQSGTLSFARGFTQTGGETVLEGGSLRFPATAQFQGGEILGSGNIIGSLNNTGATIRPGSSPGALNFGGDLTLGAGSRIVIEVGGPTTSDFDQILITGALNLGGTIEAELINGFVPSSGSSFPIFLVGSTILGAFDTVNVAPLLFAQNANGIVLAAANAIVVPPKDPFTFNDENGDTVKVTFTGKGSVNVILQGGILNGADIESIELIGTDLTSKLSVVITSKPQFDQGFGTTIGSIFTSGALQHMGSITLGERVTLGGGVADALPDLRVTGKMNTLTLDDLAPNTFIKLGQDLPYDLPGNKAPDTRNHQPALTVGDVLGAGVNIEVLGDGTPAGVGGGGFKSVTFNSWAFDGFLRTTQGIGKFLIKTGDFFGVLEVDKFRVGEETTANVGSMVVSQGSWGSSGSEIEGNIGSFDVQGFALGATITAGSMGRVKSAGELAGTFILTDPDAGGVPTFTVNSDFSARIISAVSIKKLKIKGDFTGSLEAPSIGSISAFSFLGTMGATEIVANAGKLGTLKSTTGVVRDYAIVTDEAFSGISVKGRKLSADTVGIENVSITAASIGKITVDLASDSRSAGVSLTGIRDSEFITTATGTAKGTQGSIANVTVKLKGGAGGDGTGMENVTLDARVLAGEFGVGARASTANPLGNLSVEVSGFGGASAGIVNGDFHGDTIGKTNVSVTRGGGGTARGVDGVIYMATGAIGAMKFGGDVTQNMIENLQVLAGGKLAGLNVAAKDSALGSIVDSAILAGQSLALTGSEKEQKAALSAASLGAVKIAGSLIGTQIVAGASIGGVTVGGNATNSLILAGAMLGGDFTLGDGDETFQRAAAVSSVTVKGAFTRSSIVAGIASTNATFGDADDALAAVAGALAQSSSIGSVKLGAGSGTNASGPVIAHNFAIQAAAIKSLANEGSSTVKDFAAVLYLDSGAAGEDADDVLVRLRS